MPVSVQKKDGGYEVRTPNMVHAKKTTFEKAMAQKRLLGAVKNPSEMMGFNKAGRRMKKGLME